jgi:aquaporin Z
MEALGLGLFMVSAGTLGTLLEAPGAAMQQLLPDPLARRVVMGLAMGLTAVGLIYSPWGQRSGAHLNPAVTLTFLRLGRVSRLDAAAYVGAQVVGGVAGVLLVGLVLGQAFFAAPVSAVATVPGPWGVGVAFAGELTISFVLMSAVLAMGRSERTARSTGLLAGTLVCLFIIIEAPLSGMSMNPARTLASAVGSGRWDAFWLYILAPLTGMLLAAELHCSVLAPAGCAKLYHRLPCIFCGGDTSHSR